MQKGVLPTNKSFRSQLPGELNGCLTAPVRVRVPKRITASGNSVRAVSLQEAPVKTITRTPLTQSSDPNQKVREGHYEADLVRLQASKRDAAQPDIVDVLPRFNPAGRVADVCVVGCGPSGLALASELASQGLSVALLGNDGPFVNNYGVWVDEFRELGLEGTLDVTWEDALCYFGEGEEKRIGRAYGRVCRRRLRAHLLMACKRNGVSFIAGEMESVNHQASMSELTLTNGTVMRARLVTVAAGAAAGKFLAFEEDAPTAAAQTAYGIEAEIEGYEESFDPTAMLFMDFRRHHTGIWNAASKKLPSGGLSRHAHPAGGDGLWGTEGEVPSFLYAMPIRPGRVFLEETCLVSKPALPFAVLKRRLYRRLRALNIKVKEVYEEEWSYIPVGGPLPVGNQPITAFGAAANLVHPATGYSIARSLREAPALAKSIADVLRQGQPVTQTAQSVWDALWPAEKRRQAAFNVFGMELLAGLNLSLTNDFFRTFFSLPDSFWRGFLANKLSSVQLIQFALLTFVMAPMSIRLKLMEHLGNDPAGGYLIRAYTGLSSAGNGGNNSITAGEEAATVIAVTATGNVVEKEEVRV